MNKKAFTLIELLVVIAIIALLLSVLLPALRKAKQAGQDVTCRTNLKQMGVGFQSYYMDHDEKSLNSDGAEEFWFIQIAPYMGDSRFQIDNVNNDSAEEELRATMQLIKCPANQKPPQEEEDFVYSAGTARHQYRYHWADVEGSYGMNRWVGGWNGKTHPDQTDYFFSPHTDTGKQNLKVSYRGSACTRGNVPNIADSIWVGSVPRDTDPTPDQWSSGKDLASGDIGTGLGRYTTNRHRMRTNVLYCDGHVDDVELRALWAQRWYKEFKPDYDVRIQNQY